MVYTYLHVYKALGVLLEITNHRILLVGVVAYIEYKALSYSVSKKKKKKVVSLFLI